MNHEKKLGDNNRREFLNILTKAGVGLPLLRASALGAGILASRQASAATGGIKRVVFVYIPQGTPGGAGNSYTPSAGLTLKQCSNALESVKTDCVFFSGVNVMQGGGVNGAHGNTHRVLGGYNAAKSIDFALEATVGSASPIGALRLGVQTLGQDLISSINQTPAGNYIDNPITIFNSNFSGKLDLGGEGVKRKRAVLGLNHDALTAIRTKLGSFEKARLDENVAAVEKMQRDLEASVMVNPGCDKPAFNVDNFMGSFIEDAGLAKAYSLQIDNLVLALKCDLTKVVSLQFSNNQGGFKAAGVTPNKDLNYHNTVHGQTSDYTLYRNFLSGRVAYLIQSLKDAKDINGNSLLDSTIVLQVTDMGDGSSHGGSDAPYMLAGGGTSVRRGQVVSVGKSTQLFDTVAQAMGVYGLIPSYSAEGPVSGVLV